MTGVCTVKEGEELEIGIMPNYTTEGSFTLRVFQTEPEEMKKAYEAVCAKGLWDPDVVKDDYLSGTVEVKGDDQILFTSVPWDEGWTVTVDGTAVPEEGVLHIGGALIGVRLPSGAHEISMRYRLPGLQAGVCVSLAALLLLAAWIVLRRKNRFISAYFTEAQSGTGVNNG